MGLDLVLGRLYGRFVESDGAVIFLCLLCSTDCGAGSAASSPEASREDGWSKSAVEECWVNDGWSTVVRFLFPEPDEDGEDIAKVEYARRGQELRG